MTWIVTLRGRRGTYGTGLALMALGGDLQYIPFTAKGASFSLHGLTPCEDLAPERGHVSDRKKDHVHDRSEQFLCNRLPLFLCCLLSVGATLLHLPPSLGRSTTLRCRDLC